MKNQVLQAKHNFITLTLVQNPSEHELGYVNAELEKLIEIVEVKYPVDIEKFNNAFFGNTCVLNIRNEVVHYTFDVYQALMAAISDEYKLEFD